MTKFKNVQNTAVDAINGIEELLCQMESVEFSMDRNNIESIANSQYLTESLSLSYSKWWIETHYEFVSNNSASGSFNPNMKTVMRLLSEPQDEVAIRYFEDKYALNERKGMIVVKGNIDPDNDTFFLKRRSIEEIQRLRDMD